MSNGKGILGIKKGYIRVSKKGILGIKKAKKINQFQIRKILKYFKKNI